MSEIDAISSRSRQEIFARLKKAYHIPGFTPEKLPDPVQYIRMGDDLLEDFCTNAQANMFVLHRCIKENLTAKINAILKEEGAKSLLYPQGLSLDVTKLEVKDKLCYDQPIENIRAEVFDATAGIVCCQCAVASHGAVLVSSGPQQPRLLSLAVPQCIMLLPKERIVKSICEALSQVQVRPDGKLPANIVFISGPSRTSDIELKTVYGVHGPQQVHLMVF